ncbi:N-carbamoylputrescine amidase [Chitinivorax tropicus]|uniref:N-carbamoylputrescine amidase n=1 Tax=Chitinivorax tropicus TaxID=714531 RepID=A0A840MIU5_9PROT|nr:carbon-nitrogen hydrolase family protein [Chitinivorax tropicus]MBB5019124.1 N-carbamoylputrescine amidase [Chitinivorax tropicus]
MKPETLVVATVQVACKLGDRDGNLANAEQYILQAVEQGARLVLLPEMMPGGYTLNESVWETAEPFDGPSTRWMRALSKRSGIYLGTSFLEADGEHFYNTFVLSGPAGEVVARVRKAPPASFEAYFFTGGDDCHWFDTPIGRIGVGICFENALYERYAELHHAKIDLYLRPFSGASFEAKFPVRQRDADVLNAALRDGTAETARLMGIPVLMANKVGRLVSTLPAGFPPQDIEFPGFSAIADSDGALVGQLSSGQQGVVVGTVHLLPERKRTALVPRAFGRWTAKMPWWAFIWTLTQKMGERAYAKSDLRKAKARAVAQVIDSAVGQVAVSA